MTRKLLLRQVMGRVLYSFPLQLVVLHLKKNHVMLLCWLLLFGYVTGSVGRKYGVPSIFLYPEYFGKASILSFLLLGFSLGGFITAFNLFTYIFHAYRFPFVATWSRPFLKFNINNAIIPLAFVLTYVWHSAKLQVDKELIGPGATALHLIGFLLGIGLFLLIALLYFSRTNIDIVKVTGSDADAFRPEPIMEDIMSAMPQRPSQQRKANRWLRRQQNTRKWRVDTYISWPFQIKLTRGIKHYDPELLRAVLWQNHVNGSIFQLAVAVAFIALGIFSNTSFFAIPAGASIVLLFTILLMLFSAASSWLKGWMITLLLGGTVLLNMISHGTQDFLYDTQAYGLDYQAAPAVYDREAILKAATDTAAARRDAQAHLAVLQQWLRNNQALPHAGEKPPLVIINTSGGGSRAMLWTFRCMQVADSLLGGQLMERTALLTGSSGGLIGATYYRQLALGEKHGEPMDPGAPHHLDRMAADILNPVVFSMVTNDMFIRYRDVHDGDRSYTMDRGYTFESRLNALTDGLLDIRLKDMAEAERKAETPLLVISPTILNDGRRLLISSQPVAYLANIQPTGPVHATVEPESIEFGSLFKGQDAQNLKLSSALRMSATFPYVTPVVTLPSEPRMRVMDAGVRDNYGYRTTLSFLHAYRTWLAENVGRVVVIQLRDKQQQLKVRNVGQSLLGRLFQPVGSVYGNFIRAQDQDFDLALKAADAWMPVPLDVINLQLWLDKDAQVSLSWHLTALEKRLVLSMVHTPDNRESLETLHRLVLGEPALSAAPAGGIPTAPATGPAPQR